MGEMKVAKIDTRKLWLSNKEAAKYLGVSKDWLKDRRENGTLHYAVVGNTIFYIKKEIDRLIADNAISGKTIFKDISNL
jgi:excisionase family DNA binding protein